MYDGHSRAEFESLASELQPTLYRYALWLSRDPDMARDVVQEALIRSWRAFDTLRDKGAAKSWMMTIVRREFARQFERYRPMLIDVAELPVADQAFLAYREDTDVGDMRAAMLKLESTYREPLVLQVLVGLSTREIAGVMGLTQGSVLTRLTRARRKLKELVDGNTLTKRQQTP